MTFDCGASLWEQRGEISSARERILQLSDAVGAPADLNVHQWVQLYALALQFKPDLIVDLGRGYGNSTVLFTEAARRLGSTRVISIGFRDDHAWAERTEPRLRQIVPNAWFEPLTVLEQDVKRLNFSLLYGSATRILLFWDMLGYGVSRYILEHAVSPLVGRTHLVAVKDITDGRYHVVDDAHRSANLLSPSSEIRILAEYLLRRNVTVATAEHSLRVWREQHPTEAGSLRDAWDSNFPTPGPLDASDWIYFEMPSVLQASVNSGVWGRLRQVVGAGAGR